MGNVLNSGENNDDLVDILRLLGYIKTKSIERVFRAVDRGDYVLASHRDGAYKDVSWKIGNIHLSAPCVYSKVMEGLSLQSGQSFLNLGSGTGYLSTMAGLILGHHGTNHGIELNEDCMEYAYERLDEFKQKSLALDEFDFCEPVFIHGNCLKVVPNRQYDRVYCGAACPESHEAFIKQFVKVGGILVMPYKDHLLRIERVDTDTWRHKAMLPVAFASLVIPKDEDQSIIQLCFSEPLSLQDLCRCRIRNELRKKVWLEHPELETKDPITSGPNQGTNSRPTFPLSSYIHPLYEGSDNRTSSDDDEDGGMPNRTSLLLYVDAHPSRTLQVVRAMAPSKTSENTLVDLFEGSDSDDDNRGTNKKVSVDSMTSSESSSSSSSTSDEEEEKKSESKDEEREEPMEEESESPMIIDDNEPHTSTNGNQVKPELISNKDPSLLSAAEYFQSVKANDTTDALSSAWRAAGDRSNDNVDNNSDCQLENNDSPMTENSESQIGVKSCDNSATSSNGKRDIPNKLKKSADTGEGTSGEKCDLQSQPKKKKWRKLLSKEEIGYDYSTESNDNELNDETSQEWSSPSSAKNSKSENSHKSETSDSFTASTDDDEEEGTTKATKKKINRSHKCGIPDFAFESQFAFDLHVSGNERNSPESNGLTENPGSRPHQTFAHNLDINAFSQHMRDKISQLPLPISLQLYINYNRVL